jgi:hypothetical protein
MKVQEVKGVCKERRKWKEVPAYPNGKRAWCYVCIFTPKLYRNYPVNFTEHKTQKIGSLHEPNKYLLFPSLETKNLKQISNFVKLIVSEFQTRQAQRKSNLKS